MDRVAPDKAGTVPAFPADHVTGHPTEVQNGFLAERSDRDGLPGSGLQELQQPQKKKGRYWTRFTGWQSRLGELKHEDPDEWTASVLAFAVSGYLRPVTETRHSRWLSEFSVPELW